MKKIVLLLLAATAVQNAMACDICGSGGGGSYLGLLPSFRKHFFGFRFQQNSLRHHLGPGGATTYLTTTETFRIVEAWGAINVGSRFRIAAFVPVNFIERNNSQEHSKASGLGDITAIGYYKLLGSEKAINGTQVLSQSLRVGAGVKLPSGKYNPDEKNISSASLNTFQLGTGSIDFSVHIQHDIRLQNFGINTNAGYKINTANKYDYRYGNKFTLNMLAYYKCRIGDKVVLAPNAGVLYEQAEKDHKTSDIKVFETGGRSTMGVAGIEMACKRWSLGANYQAALAQHLGEGRVKTNNRGMVYISYSL